jgi:hypothetical protein
MKMVDGDRRGGSWSRDLFVSYLSVYKSIHTKICKIYMNLNESLELSKVIDGIRLVQFTKNGGMWDKWEIT